MANVTKVTPKKKAEFLAVLGSTANVTKAAEVTAISRTEWYRTKAEDVEFAAAWTEAVETGTDALEDEAVRRAAEGTLKPVFWQGNECGYIREYSDTLLMFTLKARRPEKYRDRTAVAHSGPDGGAIPIVSASLDLSSLSTDELRRLRDLAAKISDGAEEPAAD